MQHKKNITTQNEIKEIQQFIKYQLKTNKSTRI